MATREQLLETLRARSYTYGWGAIAVFDGATLSPLLADYYAPLIHGAAALQPIPAHRIDLTSDGHVFANAEGIVLLAPRLSFAGANLQNPVVQVIFELSSGVYDERRASPGTPETISKLVNLSRGRRHTLTVSLNLEDVTGTIDANGVVKVAIGGFSNPRCSVGSTEIAQTLIGEWLWGIVAASQTYPVEVSLGNLAAERAFLRPRSFVLLPQAGPAESEGALVVFMAGPDGQVGVIPMQDDFPYLIPEGPYSATLLVSRSVLPLQEGEAQQIYGQLLIPNQQVFQTGSEHRDTRDHVVFGQLAAGTAAPALSPLRNEPGITTQMLTVTLGNSAQPVRLTASQAIPTGWTWSLAEAGLGDLVAQSESANAIYTPPSALPANAPVLLQRAIATHEQTAARYEVCFILQGQSPNVQSDPVLLTGLKPGDGSFPLSHDSHLPVTTQWRVVGRGTIEGTDSYKPPAGAGADIDLAVCELIHNNAGTPVLLGYGYSIVMLGAVPIAPAQWTALSLFTIKAGSPGAVLLSNGLQQFEIEVSVASLSDEPDISDAEFATLGLRVHRGADLLRIPFVLEGLTPVASGGTRQWGYKLERNIFQLANNQSAAAAPAEARGRVRTKTFYLHTTAESQVRIEAHITSAVGNHFSSSEKGEDEASFGVLDVAPRVPETWQLDTRIPRKRVVGDYADLTPGAGGEFDVNNPNYDWHLRTCDYWTLKYELNGRVIPFVRLEVANDGPPIAWESEQNAEDLFSYIGYALIQSPELPTHVKFASVLQDPLLYKPLDFAGEPQYASILHASAPSPGQLLLTVNRVMDVFWRQRAAIAAEAGGNFDFEDACIMSLWDHFGTRHNLQVSFVSESRNLLEVRRI